MAVLRRATRSRTEGGSGAGASNARSSPSILIWIPAERAAMKASTVLRTAHSSLLYPFFLARIDEDDLRPHRPQRSRRWFLERWRGRLKSPLHRQQLVVQARGVVPPGSLAAQAVLVRLKPSRKSEALIEHECTIKQPDHFESNRWIYQDWINRR